MIKLNTYIVEAWGGVKRQFNIANIESWCEEMGIKNYTINSQSEIDVDGEVDLYIDDKGFKELPYKFGKVNGSFSLSNNKNLISLKNCPYYVGDFFSCSHCAQLDSLEGCPKEVKADFWCTNCKKRFTKEEVMSLCKVKGNSYIHI